MTVYYFDLASGDDTTGDGSYGNPWKTIDKCTTSRTGGDECRAAKTPITTLSGTLTFTNGSTTVNTSVDLTAEVAANDIIGKNSGQEGWWKVSSVGATSITLAKQYWGISGSGSAVTGYKITPVVASEEYDIAASGTSAASRLKISGGWDLATQTQDGITAFSSTYANPIDFSTPRNYIELEKFIIVGTSTNCILVVGNDHYLHDLFTYGSTGTGILAQTVGYYGNIFERITVCGGNADGINIATFQTWIDIYIFTCATYGIRTASAHANYLLRYKAYNCNRGIQLNGDATLNTFVDCEITNCDIAVYFTNTYENRFYNLTTSSITTRSIHSWGWGGTNYFIGGSVAGTGATMAYVVYGSYASPVVVVENTSADSVIFYQLGSVTHDSSDAVSGKCIKFTPGSSSIPISFLVGSVNIPSADSDLTLYAYLKDDSSFNGKVRFTVLRNSKFISVTEKTPTTTWTQESVVVDSADLVADEYLDLWVQVTGTAGSAFIDDFSAEQ